jgi:hypothetical protein
MNRQALAKAIMTIVFNLLPKLRTVNNQYSFYFQQKNAQALKISIKKPFLTPYQFSEPRKKGKNLRNYPPTNPSPERKKA